MTPRSGPATRTLALALVVVVGCALTACASESSAPAQGDEPTNRPTTSVAAAPDSTPVTGKPAQVFGGECASALSEETVGSLLGVAASLEAEGPSRPLQQAVHGVGGLACAWSESGSAQGSAWLRITVVPASIATESASESAPYCYGADSGSASDSGPGIGVGACSFSSAEGDYLLSGVITMPQATTNADALDALTGLREQFSVALSAVSPPDLADLARSETGVWGPLAQCSDFAALVDFDGLLGVSDVDVLDADGAAEIPDGMAAAQAAAGYQRCTASGPADTADAVAVTFDFLPGGSWAAGDVAAEVGAVELAAETTGAVVETVDPTPTLHVFDGPNWLTITSNFPTRDPLQLQPLAGALVNALNSMK
ncbi:hypothetical protein B0I08_103124 [Glaciihabitans tibetensis]|uniref:DUF3558 domain-containing protein n=1 Tax=Glaciihabitans tibetensis TaxID=1266600 RepID=A0A2T0VFD7_9MICO|nr:hypothetical protein [Glaciihabitans tibetensis]PRY68919.1 hypothetical protein B0I08_103124 [Glaciihabitans tibetensis]